MTSVPAVEEQPGVDAAAESFDAYVRAHRTALVRYATLLCGVPQRGEDLVHDVLVRLYPRWATLGDQRDPHAYVRRCVTNEYLSWRRRWSTRHLAFAPTEALDDLRAGPAPGEPPPPGPDPQLWAMLLRLPRQQRAALVLRYYEGLDDGELAGVLSCSAATVRSHLSRGLASLRRDLGELNADA